MRKFENPLWKWTPGAVIARFFCGFVLGAGVSIVILLGWMRWGFRYHHDYPFGVVLTVLAAFPIVVGVAAIFWLEKIGDMFQGQRHSGEVTRRRRR